MYKALVTAGPTRERIDPVRYISNDSSGKQGVAIAHALHHAGIDVTLVLGAVDIDVAKGINVIHVESVDAMLRACESALPVDIAICAAAVCDWKVAQVASQKLKKVKGQKRLSLELVQTPDILALLSHHQKRPRLVVGFAAETENIEENARAKRLRKGCDWIVANDVSGGKVFGADDNQVTIFSKNEKDVFDSMDKNAVASRLVRKITSYLTED